MTTQEAFKRIREVHGDKYALEDGWEYKNANSDIVLFCKDHGEFHKSFYRLVNLRQGCPVCSTGVRSKPPSFWNDYNNCLDEARKYRNKFELQKKCFGCYQGLRRNNWLDEVASKFYENSIHYMKYDEKINCVYVYEFDEWKTFYVGRTNSIKRRDRQHRNGCGHRDGTREFDSVYRFAEECGIDIPKPIILEENLNAADSQKMEDEWKKRYIENGWKSLNKASTGVDIGSLGATLKWTYEACKEEATKYSSKYEMKRKCQPAYTSSVKNGWIDEFFENLKVPDGYWDDFENVNDAAKHSIGARDMLKKFGGAYNSARKHKWTKLLEYGACCKNN